jgi:hypothetical protein
MLLNRSIRDAMEDIWHENGLDSEYILANIDAAMMVAQFDIPALIIDSQEQRNTIAVELAEFEVLMSDFSYATLKHMQLPDTLSNCYKAVMDKVRQHYAKLEVDAKREGFENVEAFRRRRAEIMGIERAITDSNHNITADSVAAELTKQQDRATNKTVLDKLVADFMDERQKVARLATQVSIDSIRYLNNPQIIRNELVAAMTAGFSGIIDDGTATKKVKSLGSQNAAKTLGDAKKQSPFATGILGYDPMKLDSIAMLARDVQASAPGISPDDPKFSQTVSDTIDGYRRKTVMDAKGAGFASLGEMMKFGQEYAKFEAELERVTAGEGSIDDVSDIAKVFEARGKESEEAAHEAKKWMDKKSAYRKVMTKENASRLMNIANSKAVEQVSQRLKTGK